MGVDESRLGDYFMLLLVAEIARVVGGKPTEDDLDALADELFAQSRDFSRYSRQTIRGTLAVTTGWAQPEATTLGVDEGSFAVTVSVCAGIAFTLLLKPFWRRVEVQARPTRVQLAGRGKVAARRRFGRTLNTPIKAPRPRAATGSTVTDEAPNSRVQELWIVRLSACPYRSGFQIWVKGRTAPLLVVLVVRVGTSLVTMGS
jgi:hypothetical protein